MPSTSFPLLTTVVPRAVFMARPPPHPPSDSHDTKTTAPQWPVHGTNVTITNFVFTGSSFCITWTSLPGVHYVVQGKVNLTDPSWTDISPTITATADSTTWCVTPWPSPYHFFRVREGLANTGAVMPIAQHFAVSRNTGSTNGFTLNWLALY